LQEGFKDPVTPPTSILSTSCKAQYSKISCLTFEDLPPPTSERKLVASGVEKSDPTKIYLLPFKDTREIKLTMFQYKIIHRILPTNSLLHKIKKVASPSNPFALLRVKPCGICLRKCAHASSFHNNSNNNNNDNNNNKHLYSTKSTNSS